MVAARVVYDHNVKAVRIGSGEGTDEADKLFLLHRAARFKEALPRARGHRPIHIEVLPFDLELADGLDAAGARKLCC